jgi:hypothetical protein
MPTSKLRTFRSVEDGRWDRADARAKAAGTSVSAVLNDALERYAQGSDGSQSSSDAGAAVGA